MATYLIDYENVKEEGLHGIDDLSIEDNVIIFYSSNADKLSFGLHMRLNKSAANISYMSVGVGQKNALDFQLSTYLGYLIAQATEQTYVIISNDTGFTSVSVFWTKRKIKVTIASNLTGSSNKQMNRELIDQVTKLISDPADAKIVAEFITKYKTKQGLNNALVKKYESKKAGQIYQAIKSLIKEKKGE